MSAITEINMLHECIAALKAERDYEHTRFMEEQGKRSDLEREVEKLKAEIEKLKSIAKSHFDTMCEVNEEADELLEQLATDNTPTL